MLKVRKVLNGVIHENCFFVYNDTSLLIVDPGSEAERMIDIISELDRRPVAILLTHAHWDHIGAVDALRDHYEIPVYVHENEWDWLSDPSKNLSARLNRPEVGHVSVRPPDYAFEMMKDYSMGGIDFKVVPTPGHSFGGVSFIFDGFVMSGDALFKGSVGRSDLPTSNSVDLIEGIQTHLFTLPKDYPVYPGHGSETTIGNEIATNPFFN